MFLSQTESPILVSRYLPTMTRSELLILLISGMGSMSASVWDMLVWEFQWNIY